MAKWREYQQGEPATGLFADSGPEMPPVQQNLMAAFPAGLRVQVWTMVLSWRDGVVIACCPHETTVLVTVETAFGVIEAWPCDIRLPPQKAA